MGTTAMVKAIKEEAVLLSSAVLALLSMVFVPPDRLYWTYIDWHTLGLLFALMLVVAGFVEHNVLASIAYALLDLAKSRRGRVAAVVALTFFTSMFITNDVALITIVPLTIIIFSSDDEPKLLLYTIVLETIAANVGSALTPIGNPQNLFLYTYYDLSIGDVFSAMVLYVGSGALLLTLLVFLIPSCRSLGQEATQQRKAVEMLATVRYLLLFGVALLAVLRLIQVLPAVVIVTLASEKRLFKRIDYSLLLTFVALFVLVGNLARLAVFTALIEQTLVGHEFSVGLGVSQVVSNVPAALLLAQFTSNGRALMQGVNAGGCGTLIASMASVITFRFYVRTPSAKPLAYLFVFTAVNILFIGLFILINIIT